MKEFLFENNCPSFIGGWFIDTQICDGVIDFFEKDTHFEKGPGVSGGDVNLDYKFSIDKTISTYFRGPLTDNYFNALNDVLTLYKEKYPDCNDHMCKWQLSDHVNIQYYPPTGGYYEWHKEKDGGHHLTNLRHLVFMTYLNDVNDGGETEFLYQNIKVKPQKGLTLIWPSQWTHTHRGITSLTEDKFIITGWLNFV